MIARRAAALRQRQWRKHVAVGPVAITVTVPAGYADAVRRSVPYRAVLRPLLRSIRGRRAGGNPGQQSLAPQAIPPNAPNPDILPAGVPDTPEARDLWRQVAGLAWYHTIQLPYGIATPGAYDHRGQADLFGLPESLAGKRCLDVGTCDGFWAFEMERRGAAEVVAIDVEDWMEIDLPAGWREEFRQNGNREITRGIRLAREALHSSIAYELLNVYDLTLERAGGAFDFVFCGSVLHHLAHPLKALQNIRDVTKGEAIFVVMYDPELDELADYPVVRYLGGWKDIVWWVPGPQSLLQMVRDVGFTTSEIVDVLEFPVPGVGSFTRMVIRASV